MMDLQTDALVETVVLPASSERLKELGMGGIPTSKEITGLEVRLSRVLIKDNRTPKVLFLPGRADLYVLLLVVDNLGQGPSALTLSGFASIDDNEDLPVDKAAYYWTPTAGQPTAPTQIHVLLSVIKSKKKLRDAGEMLTAAQASAAYQSGLTQLLKAVATAPSQVAGLALTLGGIIGGFLTHVEDRPLFTQVVSFTAINGDFDALGKTVHTQETPFVRTDLTLVVRDHQQEAALAAHLSKS
ncbi:hypothetical protein IC235_05120 [Hymenobacter sp. BT664]|uniref:Uncharacterized protein n=1 Tax=Hymenobacter montanus TaxID=2771359 RepID=A0A927BBY1_9BACT|nr:hypothetical protein [Hymenobacter montanus]MBD2767267.1 hypothetical protein [Hymenobacter montanus]